MLVRLQTEATLFVRDDGTQGRLSLIGSDIPDLENAPNPDTERRCAIGVKSLDASFAIHAGAEFFLTTDSALLRKMEPDEPFAVQDPVDFVRVLAGREQ